MFNLAILEGLSPAIMDLGRLLNEQPRPADFEARVEAIARRVPADEQMIIGDLIEADYVARSALEPQGEG